MNTIREVFTAGKGPVASTPKPGKGIETGGIGNAISPEQIEEILSVGQTQIETAIVNNEPINDADFRKVIFGPGSRRNVGVLAEKIEEVEEHLVEIDERTKNQGSSLVFSSYEKQSCRP